MTVSANKIRLRARTLHRLANFYADKMTPNTLGLMRNTATMLQAANQKIAHLEKQRRADLFRAWQEGHNHCFHVEDPNNHDRNPYAPEK